MSRESTEWLNRNVLVGYGHQAWHFSADAQGDEPNHYPHAIPSEDVRRRLFSWTAEPANLWAGEDARQTLVSGHVANVRSDTGEVLGIVSTKYARHQFADSLLGGAERITGSGLGISSAGLLKGGAVGWLSVSLADTILTPEGVEFLPYIMCYGSHDGSLPTGYKRVITNVVCDNTMNAALGEKASGEYRIRHTRNSAVRVKDAQQALSLITEAGDTFATQVRDLVETTVTDRQWDAFCQSLVPIPEEEGRGQTLATNKQEALRGLYVSDPRVAPWKGTAWGVVQAVNTYTHHVQTVRGASRAERNMLGTLDGSFDALDVNTLSLLTNVLSNA